MKWRNNPLLELLGAIGAILAIVAVIWFYDITMTKHFPLPSYEDGFEQYKVVIWEDHDVILYNLSDPTDSIHLRLENPYVLADEHLIEVHK